MGYWICQILGWGVWTIASLGLYTASGVVSGWKALAITVWMGLVGIVASHQLRNWIRQNRWISKTPLQALPFILIASLVLASIVTVVNWMAMVWVFHFFRLEETRWVGFVSSAALWIAVLLLWSGTYFSVKYFERYRNAEVERLRLQMTATEAQLGLLRAQVNPHFLFNSLNGIRALIVENPTRAQAAITELSHLLRYSLQSDVTPLVPLGEELAAVEDYLKLEKMRLEDRLRVSIDIDPEDYQIRVPPMLLQTLAENAVKHGVAQVASGGELQISGQRKGGAFILEIRNPGTLRRNGTSGIGLKNARERLHLLLGSEADLDLSESSGEVIAKVRIPV